VLEQRVLVVGYLLVFGARSKFEELEAYVAILCRRLTSAERTSLLPCVLSLSLSCLNKQ
jgi:hypothetical protein